jgi:hypothetical protein
MGICSDGREAGFSRPATTNILTRRTNPTTTAPAITTAISAAWRCGSAACAIHVAALGAEQQRFCARHWREAREAARREPAKLFGASRPRRSLSRGSVRLLTAIPARIGAEKARLAYV